MEIFRESTDVWGREVLHGVSWDLLPLFFFAGVAFIVAHAVFMAVRSRRR
jgi:hypothetical protein